MEESLELRATLISLKVGRMEQLSIILTSNISRSRVKGSQGIVTTVILNLGYARFKVEWLNRFIETEWSRQH